MPHLWDPDAVPPREALDRLIAGNRRFLARQGTTSGRPWSAELAHEVQRPFAIVLGCSDSRTPVEIVFDQGFGELFVVRIAGNIVAPSVVGSIEFAASQFGARLVVVMGHTRCGAISATLGAIDTGAAHASRNMQAITDRIRPHVESVAAGLPEPERERTAMLANVRASVDHLRHGSRILEDLVLAGRLAVIGAEYELESGAVRFLDDVPVEGT